MDKSRIRKLRNLVPSAPNSNKVFRLTTQNFVETPQIDFANVHTSPKRTVANNIHYIYKGNWENGLFDHLHNISHLYPSYLTLDMDNKNNPINLGDYQYHESYHSPLQTGTFRNTSPRLETLHPVIHALSNLVAHYLMPHIHDSHVVGDYLYDFPNEVKHFIPEIEKLDNPEKTHALLTHVLDYATKSAYRRYGLQSRRSGHTPTTIDPYILMNYGRQYPVKDNFLKGFINSAMDQIRRRTTEPNAVHIHHHFPEDNTAVEIAYSPYNDYHRSL